jgi:hypothetical protein
VKTTESGEVFAPWADESTVASVQMSRWSKGDVMRFRLIVLLACLAAAPGLAQVQVNLGINFAAPPQLVAIPEVQAVQYVPTASTNYFFYGGRYWVFTNGTWYYAGGYNGPWVLCAPAYVPQPLLIVPVTYYRRPPSEWRGWHPGMPPQWSTDYGRSWSGKREAFVVPHGQPAMHEEPYHGQPVREAPPPRQSEMREAPQPQHPPPPRAPAEREEHPEHGGEEHH